MPKAACPPLPGLGGPDWAEEKWVSLVAMVTAAASCQPAHLTTNLTDELLCPVCWDGGQDGETGGWSMYGCVCVPARTSACSEMVCVFWPREPRDTGETLPGSLATKEMGLFLPLWAGQG